MAQTTCSVDGCTKAADRRDMCMKHYRAKLREGATCEVEGCTKQPAASRGLCVMHKRRRWLKGDVGSAAPMKRPNGSGNIRGAGYVSVPARGHVLADSSGRIYQHRLVLFDKIGFGPHLCHWCATVVHWGRNLDSDHLDFDRGNNRPDNVVAACRACNRGRQQKAVRRFEAA